MFFDSVRSIAEATCSSQILTAQAVTVDVGEQQAARSGITLWSNCTVGNSERDVHRVIGKQKTALEIPMKNMEIKGFTIPWLSPRDWFTWIIGQGLWPTLAGAEPNDYKSSAAIWTDFWSTYKRLVPEYEVFQMDNIDMGRTAAVLIHGDEGRTLKRHGIMVTAVQSALGRGFDSKRLRLGANGRWELKVNYVGHSFLHRFVTSAIPKTVYEDDPEYFHGAMEQLALCLQGLLHDGIFDPVTKTTYRIAVIATKGDAPYLTKMGRFYRSYNTSVKRGEERNAPKGVCHKCLAGTVGYPAEEINTDSPKWMITQGVKLPWMITPAVIQCLPHNLADPASFFQTDIWHVVHLGFGRSWVASVVQLLLDVIPRPNLDLKWSFLTSHYHSWCKRNRRQSHVSSITPYLMSYGDKTGAMGNWHKGSLTTNFMKWLVELLTFLPSDDQGRLVDCREATRHMNDLFGCLFNAGAFLTKEQCEFVVEKGLGFLTIYEKMARSLFDDRKSYLFPLYPKLHAFHEMLQLQQDARRVGCGVNAVMYCCQIDEDVVGRVSRLSRRVNIRKVMERTLARYLVASYTAFAKAKWLG